MSYVLAVHGGAGVMAAGAGEAPYHEGLAAALAAGELVLARGGSALDAVNAAVVSLEDCPLFNAGHGAVFNAAGEHELDAAIMDGRTLGAGAVAAVRHVRNPVLAARALLDEGRFVLLCAEGADRFAADSGLDAVPNSYFSTAMRRAQLDAVRGQDPASVALDHCAAPGSLPSDTRRFGTVGAVALDLHGNLAAATSTGGMTNKAAGRIGDTPMPGGGVYANNASCAVSATGTGEHFMRACVGHDVHARMAYGGAPLAAAAQGALAGVGAIGGEGGLLALSRDGALAMPFNSRGMYRGWVRAGTAARTCIFADETP
jgi:beta-aspartyl-peptidase (threonine type)